MSEHDLPKFEVSGQTEILCADLAKDSNGRVFAHLLRQTDIAAQQNSHIIREQIHGKESRDELLKRVEEQTQIFKRHAEKDAEDFSMIESKIKPVAERVENWGKILDFLFSRNGILAGALAAFLIPLAVNIITENFRVKFNEPLLISIAKSSTNSFQSKP